MSAWRRAQRVVCIIQLAQPKTDRIRNGLDIRYWIAAAAWIGSEIRTRQQSSMRTMHSPYFLEKQVDG